MTAKKIIENNQILTLDKAQSLIGKTILVTNPEDRANEPLVREVVVSLVTDYDHCTKELIPSTYALYDSKGNVTAHCYLKNDWFDEPTFVGSDENRPIYFVEK